MARFSLLAVVTFLVTLALASPAVEARKHKCPTGAHIIAVRGHPADPSKPQQGFGITKPLLHAIQKAIPNSDAESISYPKGGTFSQENSAATAREQKAIAEYVKQCPDTPIVLMGYSEGATITMNTVCGTDGLLLASTPTLSEKYTSNIIGVVVYSDGSRMPFQSYNKGTCTTNPGTYPRLNSDSCNPYADRIQSYCNNKDNYCCTVGKSRPYHFQYFDDYDSNVTTFMKGQYKKWKQGAFK